MVKELNCESMKLIADLLKTFMPEGWAFTLLTFETNTAVGKIEYISSAERESMKETMRAMIEKWDKSEDLLNINPN